MAKYDDASWHYGGDYPEDLPNESAATHIGMFLAWCINNDLYSKELEEDSKEYILQVKNQEITGARFLIDQCDEKLLNADLNDLGNAFAKDYYEDDTAFGTAYASYADDFADTFDNYAEAHGFEYPSFYHVEDTIENYLLLQKILDQRFTEWKEFRKGK